jgi:hypothetical protein
MGMQYFRKRLWIKPAFQGRLLLHIGSYFLLYLLIICLMGFLLFLQEALLAKQGKGGAGLYRAYLAELRPLFLASAILMPYFIYDLIKFSHRVAGPLHRCQKMMRETADGKPVPEFQPRKHDLMPEFFADFNALIRTWNSRITAEANGPSPSAQPRRDPDTVSAGTGDDDARRVQAASTAG